MEKKEEKEETTIGCIFLLIVFILIIALINMVFKPKELSPKEKLNINMEKLDDVKKFEGEINNASKLCDASLVVAEDLLIGKDYIHSYNSFTTAKNSCYKASSTISKLEIPTSDSNYEKKLKEIKELYCELLDFKALIAIKYIKTLENPQEFSPKKLSEIQSTVELAEKNELIAAVNLSEIKKDLQTKINIAKTEIK